LREILKDIDVTRKSPAWDDSRVTEHHAILPTAKVPGENALSESGRKIYNLICARYALQFLPDHEYRETAVEFEAVGERFRTSGREIVVPGWKRDGHCEDDESANGYSPFPAVAVGESGPVVPRIEEKMTAPPKRFTYDTLIAAMNNIYLYAEDPEIRKRLKELDGIGTSATQEYVVGLLFERGYIEKRRKGRGPSRIFSTPAGQCLIDVLNAGKAAILVKPELTALWERKITQIEKGELELDDFVFEVAEMVGEIVKAPLVIPDIPGLPRRKKCLTEGCNGYLRHIVKEKASFFACPVCGRTFKDRGGEAVERARPEGEESERIEADCPLGCGRKARRLEGPYGFFWKCGCSPEAIFKDAGGRPAAREERPKAKCPVKGCKGTAERYRTKSGERFFWKCAACGSSFDDADGNPVVREKKEKGDVKNADYATA
jgi:DNA topoisomerase-3